jgi:hypothetical protein
MHFIIASETELPSDFLSSWIMIENIRSTFAKSFALHGVVHAEPTSRTFVTITVFQHLIYRIQHFFMLNTLAQAISFIFHGFSLPPKTILFVE